MITQRSLLKAAGIRTLVAGSAAPRLLERKLGPSPAQPFADTARWHAHGSDPGHIAGQEAAHQTVLTAAELRNAN
jgi:hypothetical protein